MVAKQEETVAHSVGGSIALDLLPKYAFRGVVAKVAVKQWQWQLLGGGGGVCQSGCHTVRIMQAVQQLGMPNLPQL